MNAMPRIAAAVWAVLLLTSSLPAMARGSEATQAAESANAEKPGTTVAVMTEITFLTEPLDEEGYVDYVAALNNAASEGVTPENNAAVVLWQAFGPADIPKEIRKRYYEMLGMSPLPDEGEYLVRFSDFLVSEGITGEKAQPDLKERLTTACRRPWTQAELPLIARWVEANRKPLDLAVEAMDRPEYYVPLIVPDDTPVLVRAWLPAYQNVRHLGSAIAARAMLRIEAGEVEDAWRDLLALHRLGLLIGRSGFIEHRIAGISTHWFACRGEMTLANHCSLTIEQAKRFLADLDRLPPMDKLSRVFDLYVRCVVLDAATMMSRKGGPAIFNEKKEPFPARDMRRLRAECFANLSPDWNVTLHVINQRFDRAVDAVDKPTRSERVAAAANADKEMEEMAEEAKRSIGWVASSHLFPTDVFGARGELLGRMFVMLLFPAVEAPVHAVDRERANLALSRTALALAAYRAENGSYPDGLSLLVPTYLPDVPQDAFADAPLHYRRQDSGYLLYSVGRNGKDEGGRDEGVHSRKAELDDDLVVRTSANGSR